MEHHEGGIATAIDNETKIRHLKSRLQDEELTAYFESVKAMTPTELQTEIKRLKTQSLEEELASL